jgi:hypothetical protein
MHHAEGLRFLFGETPLDFFNLGCPKSIPTFVSQKEKKNETNEIECVRYLRQRYDGGDVRADDGR